MSLTLGEKLRQAREERGISISEVAEQTRISPLYIEAIENDDYSPLPGGIFNKGFIKSFAKFVGVDEEEALQDYSRLMSEQGEENVDDPKTYKPEVLTDDQARSSLLPTIIFATIILGLLTWGVITLVNYYQNYQSQTATNTNTNKTANSGATNANSGAPVNANPQPLPATDKINVELKSLAEPISVTYWADGKMASKTISGNEAAAIAPQQSVRISYYRGFSPDKVQLTVNGKQITAPGPPAKGNIIFEINKENIAQILQSGQISTAPANPTATPR